MYGLEEGSFTHTRYINKSVPTNQRVVMTKKLGKEESSRHTGED